MKVLLRVGLVAAVGCVAAAGYTADTPAWVQTSNQAAEPLLEYITKYTPENGSSIGIDQADEAVVDLKPNLYARSKEDGEKIVQQLHAKEATESDPNVLRDLEILIAAQKNSLETARLNQELMLPFYDVGQIVFQGLQALLDPRNSAGRQARAIVRLNRYAGQETGFEAITELAKARTEAMLGNAKLVRPYVSEVNDAINNTQTYLDGIGELFGTAKLTGWELAHDALSRQLLDYKQWLQKQILPQARQTNPIANTTQQRVARSRSGQFLRAKERARLCPGIGPCLLPTSPGSAESESTQDSELLAGEKPVFL
jgi:hypothetical protein